MNTPITLTDHDSLMAEYQQLASQLDRALECQAVNKQIVDVWNRMNEIVGLGRRLGIAMETGDGDAHADRYGDDREHIEQLLSAYGGYAVAATTSSAPYIDAAPHTADFEK